MLDFDFGFDGGKSHENDTVIEEQKNDVVDINTGKEVDKDGNPITDITSIEDTNVEKENKKDTEKDISKESKDESENTDDTILEEGTIIEFENNKYTVDKDGNLLDSDGKVFKEAKDVKSWIDSLETETTENKSDAVIDIKTIQQALGVEIQDENGKPVEFDNTAEGVASYVKAYVENSQKQIADATIDLFYSKYPIIEDVINYYVANGNSLKGFNELKDRSTIQLDTNNEAQCEAIIREAWRENNRKGNVDNYIQYLKSQNLLGATAEEELNDLIAKDNEAKEELARKADEQEKLDIENQKKYWNDIENRINVDKKIGKYQIPETIIRTKNGQRISATPKDFFNYIYQVDKNGRSAYENDLIKESQENPEVRITDDLIAAYLKFTGGNYESLVNMAINEQKVKTIKIKSKTSSKSKPIIIPPSKNKTKELDLGY